MAKKTKTTKTARRANGTILPKAKAAEAAETRAANATWGTKARHAALLKPAEPKAAPAKRAGTKGETVLAMIAKGATIDALMKATDWQAHTLRAFLSRARAAGTKVESDRADGVTTYRVAGGKAAAKPAKDKPAKAKRASAKPKADAAATPGAVA